MTDDRMDERLRDYAARWTAARPVPAGVTVPEGRRGRSWVPLTAAAAVVAVLAGVAFAVGPLRGPDPVSAPNLSASPTVSVSPTPPPPECGEEDVLGEVKFARDAWSIEGTLDLSAPGGPCTIPRAPRLDILGDNLRDLGVEYAFDGIDTEVVLTPKPRRMVLYWGPPFCQETTVVVMLVTVRPELAFRLPLERDVVPLCKGVNVGTDHSILGAKWQPAECDASAWEVVEASAARVPDYYPEGSEAVAVTTTLRNVSTDFCEVNVKPFLGIRAEDGREVRLGHAANSDARGDPPLPPGSRLRATVRWRAYCGPGLGAYTAEMTVGNARVPIVLTEHPVPACRDGVTPGRDGFAETDWVEPIGS